MTNEQTLRQYLEGLLQSRAEDPKVAERIFNGGAETFGLTPATNPLDYALVRAKAREFDRKEKLKYLEQEICAEDFIIEQLSTSMRLTQPVDLVDATKRFYEARGLTLREVKEQNRDWEKTLHFDRDSKPVGFVQLDLGPGFRTHEGKYELWVTASFYEK